MAREPAAKISKPRAARTVRRGRRTPRQIDTGAGKEPLTSNAFTEVDWIREVGVRVEVEARRIAHNCRRSSLLLDERTEEQR